MLDQEFTVLHRLASADAVEAFRDFEARSSAKFDSQKERIKQDRAFLSGTQWDTDDDANISADRTRRTVNIIANSVNAIQNAYASFPYAWNTESDEANKICEAFLREGNNAHAAVDGLAGAVSFGLGVMALGTKDAQGVTIPTAYSVQDVCNVLLDPDAVAIDGSDAREGAIVEWKSKEWIRATYGDEWTVGNGGSYSVSVSGTHADNTMPLVTYYRLEKETDAEGAEILDSPAHVAVYRMLCNSIIENECTILPISRIPIFPVWGERTWLDSDRMVFQGIVRKTKEIQKIINYAFTQLAERLAISPKPTFQTTVDAVEGFQDGYKNFTRNGNPLLISNRTTEDGKTQLEMPKRIDNSVQFADLTSIISANLDLMQSVTGVDAKGIVSEKAEQTATEILYNERKMSTNVRHYYDNLKESFKSLGETMLELLGMPLQVEVVQGPDAFAKRQIARQELATVLQSVQNDEAKKQKVIDAILASHEDITELQDLREAFNAPVADPRVAQMQQQLAQMAEQLKAVTEERDFLKKANDDVTKSIQGQVLMEGVKHQNDLDTIAFKAQLEAQNNAPQLRAELAGKQMELQKQAIQLDTAKVKAQSEIAKLGGFV